MLCSFSQMEISLHPNSPTRHLSLPALFSIKYFTLLKHSPNLQAFHLYNDSKFSYENLWKWFQHGNVYKFSYRNLSSLSWEDNNKCPTLSLCINWVSVHKNKITFVLTNRFLISEIWDSKTYSHLTFNYFQLSLILLFTKIFCSLCKQWHCTYFKLLSSLSLFPYALKYFI